MTGGRGASIFRGRSKELSALSQLLVEAGAGRIRVCLIEGEAGIGKSRLLNEARAIAEARGFGTFVARCDEFERRRPFGPLIDAFGVTDSTEARRARAASLLGLGAVGGEADPGLEFRLVDAFIDIVEAEALERNVVVTIDDMQWADPPTILTLRAIAVRSSDLPMVLWCARRPLPEPLALRGFHEEVLAEGARSLDLGPLDEETIAEIAADEWGTEVPAEILGALRGTAGNPLFASEYLRALRDRSAHDAPGVTMPTVFRQTLGRRLRFLGNETLEMLRVASVLGAAFVPQELARVMNRATADLLVPIDEALRARILTEDDERLRFRHDLLREAIYEDVAPAVRISLHRDVARSMIAAGAGAIDVSRHLTLGATSGDREAIQWLHEAGVATMKYSPAASIELLQRALGLMDAGDPARGAILADMVVALWLSGKLSDAQRTARQALQRPEPLPVVGKLRWGLVESLIASGLHDEAGEEAKVAGSLDGISEEERIHFLVLEAESCCFGGDWPRARMAAEEVVEVARREGFHAWLSEALVTLSMMASYDGLAAECRALADQALDAAVRAVQAGGFQGVIALGWSQRAVGLALNAEGRLDEAVAAFTLARNTLEGMGALSHVPSTYSILAYTHLLRGAWDDAVAEIQALELILKQLGLPLSWERFVLIRAYILWHRGDVDAALALIDIAQSQDSHDDLYLALLVEALIGSRSGAPELLERSWSAFHKRPAGPLPIFLIEATRAALDAGRRDLAESFAAHMENVAGVTPTGRARGVATCVRGMVEDDLGVLEESVRLLSVEQERFSLALAREETGAALAGAGRSEEAAEMFDDAMGTYGGLQAVLDIARCKARMRAAGIKRGYKGTHTRATTGWGALTDSERRVVDLAGEGLTNRDIGERLFISPRTVQTHLAHAFGKLGIRSRRELARVPR